MIQQHLASCEYLLGSCLSYIMNGVRYGSLGICFMEQENNMTNATVVMESRTRYSFWFACLSLLIPSALFKSSVMSSCLQSHVHCSMPLPAHGHHQFVSILSQWYWSNHSIPPRPVHPTLATISIFIGSCIVLAYFDAGWIKHAA